MSLDRRIVSILYFNGIDDVNKVEKFIGENNGYYEIIINGEFKKLQIPGIDYFEIPTVEYLEEKIEQVNKNIGQLESQSFTNNLEDVIESIKESDNQYFTTTIVTEIKEIPKEENSFEKELEKTEEENKKVLETIKKEIKPRKRSNKKIEIIESKKLDDDIDDFIDFI